MPAAADGLASAHRMGSPPGVRDMQTIMETLSHPGIVLGIIAGLAALVFACYRRHGDKYLAAATGISTTGT
ncbi:hypothetical protein GCM10028813_49000 [Ramlibacter alkalitolerans]